MPKPRFTVIDMVVLTVIFLIGFGGILPLIHEHHGESAFRIKCASNLRQIGLAMFMYSKGETTTHSFPRTTYVPDAPPAFYTGANSPNPFTAGGPAPNDVTAAMFLILRTQDITTDVFICPTDSSDVFQVARGKTIQSYSNFHNQNEHSYALTNPYPSTEALKNGFKWDDTLPFSFAIAGDIGPGGVDSLKPNIHDKSEVLRKSNSLNHDGDGQNILYADGHCDWGTTAFQGVLDDNIYTYGGHNQKAEPISQGLVGSPVTKDDTVLLPLFDPTVSKGILGTRKSLSDYLPGETILARIEVGVVTILVALLVLWIMRKALRSRAAS